jgi:hypothetical protein
VKVEVEVEVERSVDESGGRLKWRITSVSSDYRFTCAKAHWPTFAARTRYSPWKRLKTLFGILDDRMRTHTETGQLPDPKSPRFFNARQHNLIRTFAAQLATS